MTHQIEAQQRIHDTPQAALASLPAATPHLQPAQTAVKTKSPTLPRPGAEWFATTTAMIIPGLFFIVMIVLGQITPHYDAISRFGSELSLGRYGWAMIANFVILSLSIIALAVVLRRRLGAERPGRLGAAMVGLAGVAFLIAGVFVTDPHGAINTWHGALHFAAAVIIFFIAVPIAGLALSRRLVQVRWLSRYSALTGIATPALFLATIAAGPYLGLMERIVIGLILAWFTVLGAALRRSGVPASQDLPSTRYRRQR